MHAKADERSGSSVAEPMRRRNWVFGVGAAGAAALAVKALPLAAPLAPTAVAAKAATDAGGGYRLTEHVQRYYDTARA